MKQFLFILFFTYNLSLFAQTDNFNGNYGMKFETTNGFIIYKLALNADGTFVFHSYRYLEEALIKEEDKYAKGTWKSEKKLIYFSADSNDFDEIHILDFNNTKARFITKSPRDKSDREIITSILFYESEIFWMTGNILLKQ